MVDGPPDDGWLDAPVDDADAPAGAARKRKRKRANGSNGNGTLRIADASELDPHGRPSIGLLPYREHEAVTATIDALARLEDRVYQRGGLLTRVTREPEPDSDGPTTASPPRLSPVPRPVLRTWIDRRVRLSEPKRGEMQPCHPPDWLVASVDTIGEWPGVRRLESVTQCPVMRSDGTIVDEPGYDPATGLLFEPNFQPIRVPELPSQADALDALAELRDVVCDFPFVAPEHESGWLALLLTPFARFAFRGPSPLGVIDGSVAGVGKGMLAQVISVLVDGVEMSPTPQPEEVDEERKLITSIALAGRRLVLIDNVTRAVGSGPLEALLTATRWSDRVLGASRTFDGDVLTQWLVTGNNVAFRKKDTIRRVVHVRVESKSPTPEARSGFAHYPLLTWVRQERARLVRACLTILRAHAVAGWPDATRSPWGSFEGWSSRVRAALVWLGCADPADTRRELNASADVEGRALVVLLDALWREQVLDRAGLTARELLDLTKDRDDLRDAIDELCPTRRGEVTPRYLGQMLRGVKGRAIDVDGRTLAVESVPGRGHTLVWQAVAVDDAGEGEGESAPAGDGAPW